MQIVESKNYFSVRRDSEIEKAGGFWCYSCLVAHPITEQSPDPLYCQGCYSFLVEEDQMLIESSNRRRPRWIPKPSKPQETLCTISGHTPQIMAGINGKLNRSCQKQTEDGRGRPLLDLPFDLIKELQNKGYGVTEIRRQLSDQGIKVSLRTLYRILAGR